MAAHSWTRGASLLCADALGLCEEAPARHRAFLAGAGGHAGQLDEGKAADSALAGRRVLRDVFWTALAYLAGNAGKRRLAMALACAGQSGQFYRQCLGMGNLSPARRR